MRVMTSEQAEGGGRQAGGRAAVVAMKEGRDRRRELKKEERKEGRKEGRKNG